MRSLQDILGSRKPVKPLLRDQKDLQIIRANWDQIFGQMAGQLRCGYIRFRVLTVETDHPMWVQDLSFYSKEFTEKINKILGKKSEIKGVKVVYRAPEPSEVEQSVETGNAKSLEEKIRDYNARQEEKGYQRCESCDTVWVRDGQCVFCKK